MRLVVARTRPDLATARPSGAPTLSPPVSIRRPVAAKLHSRRAATESARDAPCNVGVGRGRLIAHIVVTLSRATGRIQVRGIKPA